MAQALECTVVVCTRNRPRQLTQCLERLTRQTYRYFEVLVVDSAPADDKNSGIAARFGARCVVEPHPGLSRARNTGIRHCNTSFVAFLDDDCLAAETWLQHLLDEFSDPRIMAVTGNILMPGPEFGPVRMTLNQTHPDWFEISNFGGIGSGGNMAFRRVTSRPLFDERLGRGVLLPACEESYAFYSVIQAGSSIAYTPRSVVSHPHKTGTAAFRANFRNAVCASAYFTLLLAETPHRSRVLKYCLQALTGQRRTWRPAGNGIPLGRRWWTPLAVLAGPFLYFAATLRFDASPEPLRSVKETTSLS